jgi:hypothetical protein
VQAWIIASCAFKALKNKQLSALLATPGQPNPDRQGMLFVVMAAVLVVGFLDRWPKIVRRRR